mmetsp:Transcript_19848/g.51992  ORF Transcript_19848/g.51992 Transcript_19848/m.51992 type:complete len:210 (-) Transcript_19848:174-803(-)|eukprot:CAMPEP_0119505028 /NCGR_PEP_ID=MMETSP1344-20130328/25696_1 /TAXON_ID=236787 /ORGANISM="Florenciella parvula, Strain CCMP2471" /LENGTH=209 /DNA_ID=CAMNT_0007541453 /DNA_START=65 /DNA_END=694 /DNA_ORIENTATION=+
MVTTRSKTPKKAGKPVLEELPDGKEPKKSGGGGSGKKGGLMAQYNTLMARYPLAMNMTQAGVLGGLANATEQLLKGKAVGELDFVPIMHFMIIPAFVMTPLNTQWFGYLFSLGLGKVPQLLVDSVFSSVVFNAVFSAALFTLQGNPAGIVEFVQGEFFWWGLVIGSNKCWFPAKIAMIWVIPPMYHLLFCNVVAFVWTIIMAGMMAENA